MDSDWIGDVKGFKFAKVKPIDPARIQDALDYAAHYEEMILNCAPAPKPTEEEEAMARAALMVIRAYGSGG